MLKTPSTLKWLAEKRARVAGALEPQERLLQQVESNVVKLRADLAALDQALGLFDSSVDAAGIEAIAAWAGNYGPKGSLSEFVASLVEASTSTRNFRNIVSAEFAVSILPSELPFNRAPKRIPRALPSIDFAL